MNSIDLSTTFRDLTFAINSFGMNVPYPDEDFDQNKYSYLGEDILNQINMSLVSYFDLINDGPLPGESSASQTKRHLAKFLKKFNLSIPTSIFDEISDENLIEIYSQTHHQIYRSLNFFKLSSYSIDKLTFNPWPDLFTREKTAEEKLMELPQILFSSDSDILTVGHNYDTYLIENVSQKQFIYHISTIAKVRSAKDGSVLGYLTVIKANEAQRSLDNEIN